MERNRDSRLGVGLVAIVSFAVVAHLDVRRTPETFSKPVAIPPAQELAKPSVEDTHSGRPRLVESYGKLSLHFEVNQGRTNEPVKYLARGKGYMLFLAPTETVLALSQPATPQGKDAGSPSEPFLERAVVRMQLVGANSDPEVTGLDELPGKTNYFIGNDPHTWRTNIPTYARVQYEAVYPGVDLIYYGNQGQLEYDFVVAPGADPATIQLAIDGVDGLSVEETGDLLLETEGGHVVFRKPTVYQDVDGARHIVEGRYVVQEERRVSFQVAAAYDASRPLVIDPVLQYASYLGGSASDTPFDVEVDASGHAYVTGRTMSANFPVANPLQMTLRSPGLYDVVVAKLSPDGSQVLYSTYIGGSNQDEGYGIAVDNVGNAYVAGRTYSDNVPTASPIQPTRAGTADGLILKLITGSNK